MLRKRSTSSSDKKRRSKCTRSPLLGRGRSVEVRVTMPFCVNDSLRFLRSEKLQGSGAPRVSSVEGVLLSRPRSDGQEKPGSFCDPGS